MKIKQFSHFLLSIFMLSCLAGCASVGLYNQAINSWQGKTSEALVQKWGLPSSTLSLSGSEKGYVYHHNLHVSGISGYTIDGTYYPGTSGFTTHCKTVFVIRNGIIVNITYSGTNCAFTKDELKSKSF